MAKAIATDFPRATIETLAYQGGSAPPTTLRFEPNVVTMITLNEEMQPAGHLQRGRYDRFLPLSDKQNAGAVQLLRDWVDLQILDSPCARPRAPELASRAPQRGQCLVLVETGDQSIKVPLRLWQVLGELLW